MGNLFSSKNFHLLYFNFYKCKYCNKTYSYKKDYIKHINKKQHFLSNDDMKILNQPKNIHLDCVKTYNILKYCIDYLMLNEDMGYSNALYHVIKLLDLRFLELEIDKQFDKQINIEDYPYNFNINILEKDKINLFEINLFEIILFRNLINYNGQNIPYIMNEIWNNILSEHPYTRFAFKKGKNFSIKQNKTYIEILNKLNDINIKVLDNKFFNKAFHKINVLYHLIEYGIF